jgi:hypothetical protein
LQTALARRKTKGAVFLATKSAAWSRSSVVIVER